MYCVLKSQGFKVLKLSKIHVIGDIWGEGVEEILKTT